MSSPDASDPVRAAIYARVSTLEQAREDATSLANQEAKAFAKAESKGWEVVEVFTDPGVSGSLPLAKREGGAALLEAAKAGRFDRIIVKHLDRFSRSLRHCLTDTEDLEKVNVGLVFIDQDIDTGSASGRLFRNILAAFAEFERESIAERMLAGVIGKAGQNKWPRGNVAYGYRLDDEGYVERDEAAAEVVAFIFQLVAKGESPTAAAGILNASGYRSQRGGKFGASTVARIVSRDSYKGQPYVWADPKTGDEVGRIDMPEIVSSEVWETANRVANRRKVAHAKKQPKPGDERVYGLSGRVFHTHDEARDPKDEASLIPMQGASKQKSYKLKSGERRVSYDRRYYICQRPRTGEKSTCPGIGETPKGKRPRKGLQAAALEAEVLLRGLNLLENPDRLAEYVAAYDRGALGAGDDPMLALKQAQREADEAKEKRAKLTALHLDGSLSEDEVKEELARYAAKLGDAEARLDRLQATKAKSERLRYSIEWLQSTTDESGPFLDYLYGAVVGEDIPLPKDVDGDGHPASDWTQVKSWLRSEARDVIRRSTAPGWGRGKAEKDKPRELHPAAQAWVKELAARLDLRVTVSEMDVSCLYVIGTVDLVALPADGITAWEAKQRGVECAEDEADDDGGAQQPSPSIG